MATALRQRPEVAKHGIVVLVGRDREKLRALQREIQQKGGHVKMVVCDLSNVESVKRAAAEIVGAGRATPGESGHSPRSRSTRSRTVLARHPREARAWRRDGTAARFGIRQNSVFPLIRK